MTNNKRLTSLKTVELRSLGITGFIEPKDKRTCVARKSYLTEPIELCQQDDQTEHSANLQMKTTFYMQEVSIMCICVYVYVCRVWVFFIVGYMYFPHV